MKHLVKQIAVLALVLTASTRADSLAVDASVAGPAASGVVVSAVLGKMEYLRGYEGTGFNFTAEVATVENEKVSGQHLIDVKVSQKGYALVEVKSPKNERGRRTLVRDRDMWLFLPSSSNVIRIAPLQRVFGSASIADILNVSYLNGYTVSDNRIFGSKLELSLKSKDAKATYARIDLDYDLGTDQPIETRHYTASGRLLKTIQYMAFSKLGGNPKVEKIVIYDGIRKSSAIWMKMSAYTKEDYPDSQFTKSALPNM